MGNWGAKKGRPTLFALADQSTQFPGVSDMCMQAMLTCGGCSVRVFNGPHVFSCTTGPPMLVSATVRGLPAVGYLTDSSLCPGFLGPLQTWTPETHQRLPLSNTSTEPIRTGRKLAQAERFHIPSIWESIGRLHLHARYLT